MVTKKDILKDKIWMKKAQADAKKLMIAENKIWEVSGWQSGTEVKQEVVQKALKKKFGKKKFPPVVAEILEDANYHSLNQALQEIGMVTYKGDRLKKYRKLGGKTWDL